jgi:hypothetical protein
VGLRASQGGFVTESVDVNITMKGVHLAPLVVARFQTIQPENAMADGSLGESIPGVTQETAVLKDRAGRVAPADFPRYPMQTQWCFVGMDLLANAESGCGNSIG